MKPARGLKATAKVMPMLRVRNAIKGSFFLAQLRA
jgi:hypothetical protein